jgi:hypothetical protein
MAKKKENEELGLEPTPQTPAEKAAEFFELNPDYPHEKIYVTSQLDVFHGTQKGLNALLNHKESSKPVDVTFETFTK